MTRETRVGMLIGLVLIFVFGLILAEFTGTSGPLMTGSVRDDSGSIDDLHTRNAISYTSRERQIATRGSKYHIVARGDTFYSLARRYYGNENQNQWVLIYHANQDMFRDDAGLSIGARLIIPALDTISRDRRASTRERTTARRDTSIASRVKTYTIKSGDTLSSIARETMGSGSASAVRKLYNANVTKLSSPDRLGVGIKLVIPR